MRSCSFISLLVVAGILCVSVAGLDHFMMLMWRERTPVSSGRLKGALDSCPLMRTEKSSSWGKAVRQNDLRSVFVGSCSSSRNTLSHQAYFTAVFKYRSMFRLLLTRTRNNFFYDMFTQYIVFLLKKIIRY